MKQKNRISIIIPVFNEEKNLEQLIPELIKSISEFENEIIIVNDNSNDKSELIISKFKEKFPQIIMITNSKNLGQSYSINKGIEFSKFENIVTLDGDGQNDPKDIPKLSNIYFSNQGYSLVGGIRFRRVDSFSKIIASKIANSIRGLIFNDKCKDTGCSLKIFDKKTFQEIPYFNGIHRFLPALFVGLNKQIFFINVNHRKRQHGVSKYGNFTRLFKGIYDIVRVLNIIKKIKNDKLS